MMGGYSRRTLMFYIIGVVRINSSMSVDRHLLQQAPNRAATAGRTRGWVLVERGELCGSW
jgi:hypothetical protein